MASDLAHTQADAAALIDENWSDVLSAVDATYAELVEYQSRLEAQNEELDGFRRLLTSILQSIKDVMVVVDRDGRVEDASASLEHLMGVGAGALKGQRFSDFFDGKDQEGMVGALQWLRLSKGRMAVEASVQGQDGLVPFDFGISGRYDARGRLIGAVVLGHPLGELRQAYSELAASHEALKSAQAQLVRNEKLAGLGRLLAGVAHELNNPISFVYANAHALERYIGRFETYFAEVESGAPRSQLIALREELRLDRALRNLRAAIDGAKDGSERVRDIVDDLRRLSSDGARDAEPFDFVDVSRVAARWVERGSKSGITPVFTGAAAVQVMGSPGHVQQIVMNLVQNAMDALKGVDDPKITIAVEEQAGAASLTVTDNGPGIPEDIARSVFDPFFTTKPVGQGTGLGLAISHKIAEEHGGTLTLEDTPEGTTFRLTLPTDGASGGAVAGVCVDRTAGAVGPGGGTADTVAKGNRPAGAGANVDRTQGDRTGREGTGGDRTLGAGTQGAGTQGDSSLGDRPQGDRKLGDVAPEFGTHDGTDAVKTDAGKTDAGTTGAGAVRGGTKGAAATADTAANTAADTAVGGAARRARERGA